MKHMCAHNAIWLVESVLSLRTDVKEIRNKFIARVFYHSVDIARVLYKTRSLVLCMCVYMPCN